MFFSCGKRGEPGKAGSNLVSSGKWTGPNPKYLNKFEMFYIVQDGDDIFKIAKLVDTKPKWIIKRNCISSPSDIFPGIELIVPTP